MPSRSSQTSITDVEQQTLNILEQWRSSSAFERLMLVRQFRCYYDLALRDSYRRIQLLTDVKTLLSVKYPMSNNMQIFCQNLLWNYRGNVKEQPLFIPVRGEREEDKNNMLSQFKFLLPDDTLRIVRQFYNYRTFAKSHPFLRTMIMRNALNKSILGETDLHEFSLEIFQEFKLYDMWLDPRILKKELSELETEDLVSDIVSNEYHLMVISKCHFTTFRIMRYISEVFPRHAELARLLSLQLREDKCDKYMEKLFYKNNRFHGLK